MSVITGVDTLDSVTKKLIAQGQQMLGGKPHFWGRYFKKPGDGVYKAKSEAPLLRDNSIALLPIARQTKNVAGDAGLGAKDAKANVAAFIEAVGADHLAGQGKEFLMFLDVEGTEKNPSLSPAYYKGWAGALVAESRKSSDGRFTILPAVYGRTKDADTWTAIGKAVTDGAEPCRGAWVARGHLCSAPNPATFETAFLTPDVPLAFPVLIWQFKLDCPPDKETFDLDMVNSDEKTSQFLLTRLAIP